ncbi:MAG TPA: GyrI-like domain-containing protein [Desulfosporosinus sp.]|nr:GyrI-like domain-containing protein [Desulfosporosinus sp.]
MLLYDNNTNCTIGAVKTDGKKIKGCEFMKEKTFDFKKEFKDLYMPKTKPMLLEVPSMNFIMVDGKGDPNNNELFQQAIEILYGLSYTIKMSKMKGDQPEGYFNYTVPPLEGLWTVDDDHFSLKERGNWVWSVMIRQPDFVTIDVFNWACKQLKTKKPALLLEGARFETYEEGLCVQMMHIGPFATEPETMEFVNSFINAEGLKDKVGIGGGRHHEIYLSDPRKSQPEKMKTVLRHPVARTYG